MIPLLISGCALIKPIEVNTGESAWYTPNKISCNQEVVDLLPLKQDGTKYKCADVISRDFKEWLYTMNKLGTK